MQISKLEPNQGHIIVQLDTIDAPSDTGIIVKASMALVDNIGVVVSTNETGLNGQVVVFDPKDAQIVQINGKRYAAVKTSSIFAYGME